MITILTDEQRSALKLDAAGLQIDDSDSTGKCPVCGIKGSFGIKRVPEGIVYNCFRLKCGAKGFIPMVGGFTYSGTANFSKPMKLNPYEGRVDDLPETIYGWIYAMYELNKSQVDYQGWKYDGHNHRVIMPGHSYFGYEFVKVAKKLPNSAFGGPKAVSYFEHADPTKIAFPRPAQDYVKQDTLVLVEDLISATKVGSMLNCAALLGTGISKHQVAFLASHYRQIILMLDNDAIDKALTYSKQYGSLFDSFKVVYMDKDPKDTPYKKLESIILQNT